MRLGWQRIIERAYLVDPRRTASDLVELGLGDIAASCKVDYESGRMQENHRILEPKPSLNVRAVGEGVVDFRNP